MDHAQIKTITLYLTLVDLFSGWSKGIKLTVPLARRKRSPSVLIGRQIRALITMSFSKKEYVWYKNNKESILEKAKFILLQGYNTVLLEKVGCTYRQIRICLNIESNLSRKNFRKKWVMKSRRPMISIVKHITVKKKVITNCVKGLMKKMDLVLYHTQEETKKDIKNNNRGYPE